MGIERDTIEWVAGLARIDLTDEEKAEMEQTLGSILEYMDILGELDLEHVQPTSHVLGYTNVTREDNPRPGLPVEAVRRLAPRWDRGHVVVPRIV
ncbi:MAG: Asp-tRNA(Asn)/Glu-tRNA(Gln) amidotransferase subunit GatC [Spirochaetota bacterium]